MAKKVYTAPLETGTGLGQVRRMRKSAFPTEAAAFARLKKRGVVHPEYKLRAEHTEKCWTWRRVG